MRNAYKIDKMSRKLTSEEIEDLVDFITPQKGIPLDSALAVCESRKDRFRAQLYDIKTYPELLPKIKHELLLSHHKSLVEAGESVGVLCAQSIGEKQTQTCLNSIDWKDKLLFTIDGKTVVSPIGEFIDNALLCAKPENITHIPLNRTQYLPLREGYMIPSCDQHGMVGWYRIEAVTKHLPMGQLVKVVTQSGREVTATQAKSFLVWDGTEFVATNGSDLEVGDILPTTHTLKKPSEETHLDLRTIFPMTDYVYTTEIVKAREFKKTGGSSWWKNHIGVDFILPYNRPDTCFGKRNDFYMSCEPGFVYIHTSNELVSHIPDMLPLDSDLGFLIGLYLADGWATKTFVGISNKDEVIRRRITDYCDRYGVTYHLVVSAGKNVRNGESHDLKIHSTLLARFFIALCGTGSSEKKVPDITYTSSECFVKGVLDGYFSGDGCVDKKTGSVLAYSVSQDLLMGISFLLSYYGIFGRMSSGQQTSNNVGSKNIKRLYTLTISNGFAQKFATDIPLTENRKQTKLNEITLTKTYRYNKGKSQEAFPPRDIYFDEVVSIELVDGSTEFVYDLTVESTRNFQGWNGLNFADTFHKAGLSEKTMTTGAPRIQELLNASKDPKNVNCKIYFNDHHETIQDLRETVGHSLVGLSLKALSNSVRVFIDKEEEPWYAAFRCLYSAEGDIPWENCIRIELNTDKLYEYRLTTRDIATKLQQEFGDVSCVWSPRGILDVFMDTRNIELPEERVLYVDSDNAVQIYMEECALPSLEQMIISGIHGIGYIFYTKENEEWIVETESGQTNKVEKKSKIGHMFSDILSHPDVDMPRTVSNDVWDVYTVLGVEAARQFLIDEYMNLMEGINLCHPTLLVERMTFTGTISSISRYTMRKDETGPMGRASFEETLDNFTKAAVQGQTEPTIGVSASIICGKRSSIGTGMIDIKMDMDMLDSIGE
jgi:DNA-directed RNA polymerase subunit A"